MLLVVIGMYKSRFAEHAATAEFHPQLRRFAACSGLRIEVYLRHTRGTKTITYEVVCLMFCFVLPSEALDNTKIEFTSQALSLFCHRVSRCLFPFAVHPYGDPAHRNTSLRYCLK